MIPIALGPSDNAMADMYAGLESVAAAHNHITDELAAAGAPNLYGDLMGVANGYVLVSQALKALTSAVSSGADPSAIDNYVENAAGAENQLATALNGVSAVAPDDGSGDGSGDSSGDSTKEALQQNVINLEDLTQSMNDLTQAFASNTEGSITQMALAAQQNGVTTAMDDEAESRENLADMFTDFIQSFGDDGTMASIVGALNDASQAGSAMSETLTEAASQ